MRLSVRSKRVLKLHGQWAKYKKVQPMYPPFYHHNGFMASPELQYRMYGYILWGRIALWSHQSALNMGSEQCIVQTNTTENISYFIGAYLCSAKLIWEWRNKWMIENLVRQDVENITSLAKEVRERSLFMARGGGGGFGKINRRKKKRPLPPREYMGKNRPPPLLDTVGKICPPSSMFKKTCLYVAVVLLQQL